MTETARAMADRETVDPAVVALGASNPRLKRLRRLSRQTKVRSQERAFVVDGPTLVAEALASDRNVEGIYVGSESGLTLLHSTLDQAGVPIGSTPIYVVDDDVLSSVLDPANPRPVAAVVGAPVHELGRIDPDLPVLLAVELRDPGNLGTMIRTAEAAGFGAVTVAGDSVDYLNPKTVRASAGSVLRMPVIDLGSVTEALGAIAATGRLLVATVVDASAPSYDGVDLTSAAIVVGNEPHGLDDTVVAAVDSVVTIPMAAGIESLNVGAAAAVLAFEAARQRRVGPKE